MAGHSIARIYHKVPTCTSPNKSLQVFLNDDGTHSGYCFSCGVFVANPLGHLPPEEQEELKKIKCKTPEEIAEEIAEIRECKTVDKIHRGMGPDIWKYYGVRLGKSEYDGVTDAYVCFPRTHKGKLVSFKVKMLNKKVMWSVGENINIDLYGWERAKKAGGKTLYITEGEEDCQALRLMLMQMNKGTDYAKFDYAIVSLNNGAHNAVSEISKQLEEINETWPQVVLVFDQDRQGQDAAREVVSKLLPNAMIARLPCKDANACLIEGRMKAVRDAVLFNVKKSVPSNIRTADSLLEEALQPVEWGVSTPWPEIDAIIYGARKKEVWGVGGGTGCGKTTLAHELGAHFHHKHNWRTLAILMEETGAESVRNFASKIDSIPYNTPGLEYDKERFTQTVRSISNNILMYNHDEISDPHSTWEGIKTTIRVNGTNLDFVLIDNLTAMSEGLTATEKNEFIGKVAKESVDLATKFDLTIALFSHLNPPEKGKKSHENGGRVHESQFTGSRALQRYCHLMWGFERNKTAVDPNCSVTTIIKNRKYGKTGRVRTYYDANTARLLQRKWADEMFEDAK